MYNYGTYTENYTARMKIGSFYNQVANVTSHAPGARILVTFPGSAVWPRGTYSVSCSTELTGDWLPANNKRTGSVIANGRDAALRTLFLPAGAIDSGTVVSPACSVFNYGSLTEAYPVRLKIGSFYDHAVNVTGHVPGAAVYVTFPDWNAVQRSLHSATCTTELARDGNPANDWWVAGLSVRVADVGPTAIVVPSGAVDSNRTLTPQARIRNFGTAGVDFNAQFTIGSYTSTRPIAALAPGEERVVDFDAWTAPQRGAFTARCVTLLGDDMVPGNDERSFNFNVLVHDVGAVAIIAPFDTTVPGPIAPQARIRNYGTQREPVAINFKINATPPYSRTVVCGNGLPLNADTIITFSAWSAVAGTFTARCSIYLPGEQVPGNDIASRDFIVTSGGGQPGGWTRKADLPAGAGKSVNAGGALAYNDEATGECIYAFKGNGTCEFFQYATSADAWTAKAAIPLTGRSGRKKTVKKGAVLTATGGKVYATKGNNSYEMWEYDPATDAWAQKADIPIGAKAIKEGAGATVIDAGGTVYIYFLKGSATTEYYRYNPLTDAWEAQADAPLGASGKPYKNGSAVTGNGTNTVYALKASFNEFAAYDVATNAWTGKTGMPLVGSSGSKKKAKDGCGIAWLGGSVYGLKGGNTREFYGYNPTGDAWTQYEDLPLGASRAVKGGGALAATGAVLYALKGNKTFEFFQYVVPTVAEQVAGDRANEMSAGAVSSPRTLLRAGPNPCRGTANITYSIPRAGRVSLKLYDATGSLIRTLNDGYQDAGNHAQLLVSGSLTAGVYLLELDAAGANARQKVIIE